MERLVDMDHCYGFRTSRKDTASFFYCRDAYRCRCGNTHVKIEHMRMKYSTTAL